MFTDQYVDQQRDSWLRLVRFPLYHFELYSFQNAGKATDDEEWNGGV
jgi:hypothetical protein